MRQTTKLLAATLACGLSAQTASAQFSSSSRTGSTSGNALTNTSGLGSSTSGLGGAQGQSFGGAAGQGNAGANRTAGNGQSTLGQSLLNQGNTQNGFIGGRNQQQQFIGGNQRTTQNARQQNQFGNQGRQQRQNQDDNNGTNQQNQNNQRRAIRPQQKVAFEIPQRTETEVRTTLQTRFDGLVQNPALRNVTFEMDSDGIVTLRGEVATTSARQLAANLVRLEPGVRKVVNELTVP
jgi:osmotically-inducible protein OsmY